jgi:hypothetical protein
VEYLLWKIKTAPSPGPLVTTGNPADPLPGALGQPGTRVLLGNSPFRYDSLSGGRITLGGWLDAEATLGAEASGFLLERGSTHFALASDANGNPPIYIPVINQTPTSTNFGHEGSIAIADVPTAGLVGNIAVGTATNLWGAEANAVFNLARSDRWSVTGLAGFSYLDLRENLTLSGSSTDVTGVGVNQMFLDQFNTANHFYGGQIGARIEYRLSILTFEALGEVALGGNQQTVHIQGVSQWSGPGFSLPPGVYPGGLLTEPSNIGERSGAEFAVVPRLQAKVGCDLASWARLTVGYDFLYWTGVVRPGNQIDRSVNFTQIPGAQLFFGPPIPPAVPEPLFKRSDFYAHGLNVGLTFSF